MTLDPKESSFWCPSRSTLFVLLLLTLGVAELEVANSSPPDGQIALRLDRSASKIEFSLGATLHTVHGTFEVKEESMLRVDPASGQMTGRVVVDVQSGQTGNRERDRDMHQDVLGTAQFPEAVFSPTRLRGKLSLTGESEVAVRGILRIHGQDHDVTLPAKISIENGHFTATSYLSIPYVKWGMKDPSTIILRVKKTVELEIRIAGTISQ